jgi:hypothetical protein
VEFAMRGGENMMKKLIYALVFVSLTIAAVFWATCEVDYLTCTACINPYLIGT